MQSVSSSADSSIDREPLARLRALAAAVSRYDLVLAVIPLTLILGVTVGHAMSSLTRGIGAGGVVALAATAYALFYDPPRTQPPRGDSSR